MSDYSFHRVDERHYKDLVCLVKAAFNATFKEDFFKSKNATDYLGVKHLGFIAYDANGKPAAFYGVYPYMMSYRGKQYFAAQSGDTMTHPAHAGKGLFTTLAKMTYDLAAQEGVQFIFGFPNNNSYPGFVKKLSWIHKENMSNYRLQVPTIPLAGLFKKLSFLLPVYNSYANIVAAFAGRKSASFPNSVINEVFGGVDHSAAFLNYKSFNNNYVLNIGDRLAWIKIDGGLLIGDIEIKDVNDISVIVSSIKRLAFFLGCSTITFAVGKDTFWDLQLRKAYAAEEGSYVGYLDLKSGLPLHDFKYTMADFDTF